jgi:signal transduction histidine kinase/ligand-binding sensor domain-containing protein
VHCLAIDHDGNIWIGTDGGGVSIYDGYKFKNISTLQGLANDVVYGLSADSKGNMWIATAGGGASKFDGDSFYNYNTENGLASNFIIDIAEDKKGYIWFATSNKGVTRYDGSSFIHFTADDGLAENAVNCITVDSFGNIWFGTRAGGVSMYQERAEAGRRDFFSNFSVTDGLGHQEIWQIIEDRGGNIWFATGGGGVSRYNGEQFLNFTTSEGLPENVVNTIAEDRSGNIWAGTASGGVVLFMENAFRIFTSQQGLGANSVYGITEDLSGNLWFGTNGGGITKYDGTAFTSFSTDQGLAHSLVISSFRDSRGNLWFGTGGGGVSLYQEGSKGSRNATFTTYNTKNGLPDNVVYSIIEDSVGNLWFGTGGGLVKFDVNLVPVGQAGFTAFTTTHGLAANTVYGLLEDSKGIIWIGTAGGGLSRFDGKSFANYTTAHGLSNNIVWSILEDKLGNLWFATQGGGVTRFDGTIFSEFTSRQGLSDDNAYDLLEDNEGNIFIGTNRGFTVVPEYAMHLPVQELKPYLEYYNTSHGYPVRDVNKGAFFDSRGSIWVGNGSFKTALVSLDYKSIEKKKTKPIARIKSISLNDKAISWTSLLPADHKRNQPDNPNSYFVDEILKLGKVLSDEERQALREEMKSVRFSGISRFENFPEQLVLPNSHNSVTIDFGTDELARAHLIEYSYILEGYNKNWSPAIKKTTATFGNISEGDYTFKVMARYTGPADEGARGWSEAVVYSFKVLPPWYRSWWAYTLYGIFFLLGVRRVHTFQKKRTLRKERERAQRKELEQAREIEKAYSELKATQAQLIQAEKMASLGELTAGIAHEIQNPLNFVNNFSEVSRELISEMNEELAIGTEASVQLAREIAGDIDQNLEKIYRHGKRAGDIVKGMLQHSRTSSDQKEPTDINALADEYLRLSYHGLRAKDKSFNADFKTDFDPNLPKINVIPQDLGRVMLNLVNNAFYAVHERSKKGETGYEPKVTITTQLTANSQLLIAIKDNGPGIPDEIKNKIFQPFFTTKPTGQGTGLGLSLSYDIVKVHGGELTVETKKDEGTVFLITIPADVV